MAEAHFRQIHEAYQVLSDEKRRANYDHERWLSGRFSKFVPAFSPDYLLQEIQKLNSHINSIDVYRMNKQLLFQYLSFLLKDEKLAVINRKGSEDFAAQFIPEVLKTIAHLPPYYAIELMQRLKLIENQPNSVQVLVAKADQDCKRRKQWQSLFPWLIVLFTLLVCLGMYWFSRR